MGRTGGQRRERAHRPSELGPRIIWRGRFAAVDLRPWGMGRPTMRDPRHPGWPEKGERTELPDVAERWRWSYHTLALEGKRSHQLGRPEARPLGKAVYDYLAYRDHAVERYTRNNDGRAMDVLLESFAAETPLHEIDTAGLQSMFDVLLRAGYAVSSMRTYKASMSAFFAWAKVEPNPLRGVELPRERKHEIFTWSDDELVRLRAAADASDYHLARRMLELGLAAGARYRELLALRWEDFDERSRTVRIRRQMDGYYNRTKLPKRGKMRTAVVLPFWWEHHQPELRGYVLARPDGRMLYGTSGSAPILDDILARAKLAGPQRGFHDLRRTYGRLFLEAGGWMDELQRSLGHDSIRTTEQDYGEFQEAVAAQFAVDRMYGDGRQRRLRVVE